jgi:hypothetical protein
VVERVTGSQLAQNVRAYAHIDGWADECPYTGFPVMRVRGTPFTPRHHHAANLAMQRCFSRASRRSTRRSWPSGDAPRVSNARARGSACRTKPYGLIIAESVRGRIWQHEPWACTKALQNDILIACCSPAYCAVVITENVVDYVLISRYFRHQITAPGELARKLRQCSILAFERLT